MKLHSFKGAINLMLQPLPLHTDSFGHGCGVPHCCRQETLVYIDIMLILYARAYP